MYSYFKNYCCLNIERCIVILRTTEGKQEYEEVIEEYEEEILM